MSQSSGRGFRNKNAATNERSLDPENYGNRRTFEEMRIPPDDVGNKIEADPIATFVHDSLGNSVLEEPAHLKSGILSHLLGRERGYSRRIPKDLNFEKIDPPRRSYRPVPVPDAQEYMAALVKEFTKLLSEKSGLPFSFSMKTINISDLDKEAEKKHLVRIRNLIDEILSTTMIDACVSLSQYCTAHHRFAVFFINPKDGDPSKNKDLISALRQIVKLYTLKYPYDQVNVFLVLANAENVIESHLHKIGAKKDIDP